MNNAYYACLLLVTTCVHTCHNLTEYHEANTTNSYYVPSGNLGTVCAETQKSINFITSCLYACFENKQTGSHIDTHDAQQCYRNCARKEGFNGAGHLMPTVETLCSSLILSGIFEPTLEHLYEACTDWFAEFMVNRKKKGHN